MQLLRLSGYDIQLGPIAESLPLLMKQGNWPSVLMLCDENTRRHCLPVVAASLPIDRPVHILEIPAGETYKTLRTCEHIWQEMLRVGVERSALLLNLGGGVVGDMGGFCAATYKRGIDFVQIPTTLLSQVDASIGGKLGIDFGGVKNSIGVFQNPKAVCIDPVFLDTLPERELRSGFAEVIKHTLIADGDRWQTLLSGSPESFFKNAATILHSLRIKQAVVEADPFEKGLRKALNFGHTIGHAVESWALDTEHPLLHGEAIAIGMIAEAVLSHQYAGLPESDLKDICRYLQKSFALPRLSEESFDQFIELMQNDKKNAFGRINFTLLEKPGQARVDQYAEEGAIRESLHAYNALIS